MFEQKALTSGGTIPTLTGWGRSLLGCCAGIIQVPCPRVDLSIFRAWARYRVLLSFDSYWASLACLAPANSATAATQTTSAQNLERRGGYITYSLL